MRYPPSLRQRPDPASAFAYAFRAFATVTGLVTVPTDCGPHGSPGLQLQSRFCGRDHEERDEKGMHGAATSRMLTQNTDGTR